MKLKALTRLYMSEETRKKCITKNKPVVLYNKDRSVLVNIIVL